MGDGISDDELQEWVDALESLILKRGEDVAYKVVQRLLGRLKEGIEQLPFDIITTKYANTIPLESQKALPGDAALDHRIRSFTRWNAAMMVMRAGRKGLDLGGHIASFQSSATLYDVGWNYFWRGADDKSDGDLIFFQGHSSPGMYARAFLEGRITESQMDLFRQEVSGLGLSSYPHPRLMKDFWQFPTVSMGLGPIQAIYQARFLKYLESRGLARTPGRKVWCFCGDGEMDEPESMGAIGLAAKENLDNLIFVINCNLQRLDGPVNGNGKIIQIFEGDFRGAGWNVYKVIWGSLWDNLLARDRDGLLQKRMDECVDGDYQTFKSKDGAYVRKHFFGFYPELLKLVENMSDDDIWQLNRGGHDPKKVYAAYYAAVNENKTGKPTVILAKTIKGYLMGSTAQGKNIAHQAKKMDLDDLKKFRDYLGIPINDAQLEDLPYYKPADDSPEMSYLRSLRQKLGGGYVPSRRPINESLTIPDISLFKGQLSSSQGRKYSTTMAFVRILATLLRDENLSKRVVPIVPDESRTFGLEGMFRQYGIWSSEGQKYVPEDSDQLMFYKESTDGQILQEGINEPGAMSSWLAAGTSYANNGISMIPFYIYYSMFGFQRIGDLAWAAGDLRARGFLLGGTSGRTTLNGEGLQHQDGHSHIQASLIPSCISYDPTFAYELALIIHDGLRRMYRDQEDVFYYLTLMNENYEHPSLPDGKEEEILRGMYLFSTVESSTKSRRVQLLGCGTILLEVIEAANLLESFGISSDIWSVTSFNELRREGLEISRLNLFSPHSLKESFVEAQLSGTQGPIVAATDHIRAFADQIRAFIPAGRSYITLGTDGYGRSDSRANLRSFFEVDRFNIAFAAISALYRESKVSEKVFRKAMKELNIDPNKKASWRD